VADDNDNDDEDTLIWVPSFLDSEDVTELSLGGDLELYYKDRALMTWTLVEGHKGLLKGLRASGPQGLEPLFTDTHTCS
jgi:hypothetical protein